MNHLFRICILSVSLLVAVSAPEAQTVKPRLAIKTLENPTTIAKSVIGDALSEILFSELDKTGRFELVERSAFEKIAKQIDFGTSDWVKKDSVAGKGWMAGVDYVLIGKVTEFSFVETPLVYNVQTARGKAEQKEYKQDAAVRFDFRVVATATGVSIVTESASDSRTAYGSTSEMARFMRLQQVGFKSAETQNSLIGRAAVAACQKAMRKIRDKHPVLLNHLLKIVKDAGAETSQAIPRPLIPSEGILVTGFCNTTAAEGLQKRYKLTKFPFWEITPRLLPATWLCCRKNTGEVTWI